MFTQFDSETFNKIERNLYSIERQLSALRELIIRLYEDEIEYGEPTFELMLIDKAVENNSYIMAEFNHAMMPWMYPRPRRDVTPESDRLPAAPTPQPSTNPNQEK